MNITENEHKNIEGLFETMSFINGRIILEEYHFERLFSGLNWLGFKNPESLTKEIIRKEIVQLCENNNCSRNARVRLSVFLSSQNRSSGKMQFQHQVEVWPLNTLDSEWNDEGLVVDIFSEVKKKCDQYSNLKTINRVIYEMGEVFSKQHQLNDCLILNEHGSICESTIANIFWIKNEIIYTPPLSEGCVAGVMRKYLMEKLPDSGYKMWEQVMGIKELKEADEVFLTNAIKGIRWVKQFRKKTYDNRLTSELYKKYFENSL